MRRSEKMHSDIQRIIRSAVCVTVMVGMTVSTPHVAFASDPASASDETTAQPAEATDDERAAELVERGAAAYESGELQEAIDLFQRAHELNPKSNLVFNIGRVYEELGNLEKAVDHYAKFVVLPGIDLENRKLAAERIRVLREVLAQTHDANASETDQHAAVQPPPPVVDASSSNAPAPMEPVAKPVDRGRNLRIAGFSLLGVGLGTGAAALGLGVSGLATQAKAETACAPLCSDAQISSIRTKMLAADVLGGLTAAFVTASAVMIAVGFKRKKGELEPRVAAVVSPNQLGVRVRW